MRIKALQRTGLRPAADPHPVEVVEKVRRRFRNSDDEKSASQNALRSTIDGLGGVKGPPKIRCIDHSGLFLQAR